eukprot:5496880-Prymnesium_polylepis.1
MQARQSGGGGGGERRVATASCKRRGEDAQGGSGVRRKTQLRASEGASSSGAAWRSGVEAREPAGREGA